MIDTILSIVGTLAGVYIGAIASVKSARITAKEQQHYIESSRFRSFFSSELADLHYGKDDGLCCIFQIAKRSRWGAAVSC